MTAKHRLFVMLDADVVADQGLVVIASNDAMLFGVLSSRIHCSWASVAGGTLEDRPRYNQTRCFETFPFPSDDTGLTPELAERIRTLAEQIDAHRKTQLAAHPDATLTATYNVLEKLRSGEALTAKDKLIHAHGLVGVLLSLHDELDAAVLQAYGWADLALPADTDALLARLVDLNARRTAEEAAGTVRWLRPEFQQADAARQATIDTGAGDIRSANTGAADNGSEDTGAADNGSEDTEATDTASNRAADAADEASDGGHARPARAAVPQRPWPNGLTEQIKAVADVLAGAGRSLDLDGVAAHFNGRGRWRDRLPTLLDTLVALGRARLVEGRWVSAGV